MLTQLGLVSLGWSGSGESGPQSGGGIGRITGEATHFELGSELHNGGVSLLEQLVGGLGGKSSALRIFST